MSEVAEEIAVETTPEMPEAVETPAPEAVETPALTPEYDPTEDPRVIDLVRTQAGQIAKQEIQALIAQAREQAGGEAPGLSTDSFFDELGNFDPVAFAAYQADRDETLTARFEQMFNQVTQPLQDRQQAEAFAEGEKQMRDVIADLSSREGELVGGDVAVSRIIEDVRNKHFPEISQRIGVSNRAAEIALERAYRAEHDYQKSIADAAIQRHVNRNAELAGVRGEPGSGSGSGLETNGRPEGGYAPGELALKFGANAERIRSGS